MVLEMFLDHCRIARSMTACAGCFRPSRPGCQEIASARYSPGAAGAETGPTNRKVMTTFLLTLVPRIQTLSSLSALRRPTMRDLSRSQSVIRRAYFDVRSRGVIARWSGEQVTSKACAHLPWSGLRDPLWKQKAIYVTVLGTDDLPRYPQSDALLAVILATETLFGDKSASPNKSTESGIMHILGREPCLGLADLQHADHGDITAHPSSSSAPPFRPQRASSCWQHCGPPS